LNSKSHKKNEARFEHAKEIGVDAFEEECRLRAEERERAKDTMSNTKMRNFEYWKKQRERGKKKTRQEIAAKRTPEQIERCKEKFQAKKTRRLARKAAEAEAAERLENSESSGKEKKGTKQEAVADPVPSKKKAKVKQEAVAKPVTSKKKAKAKRSQ